VNLVRVAFCLCCVIALLPGCGDKVDDLLQRAQAGDKEARYQLGCMLWDKGERAEGMAWAWAAGRASDFMKDHDTDGLAGALDRMIELRKKYGPPLTPWEQDRLEIQRNATDVYAIATKERETKRVAEIDGYLGWSYSVTREKSDLTVEGRSFVLKIQVFFKGEKVMDLKELVTE